MSAYAPDAPPVPVWLVLWLAFVAGALLVPSELIQRFIVEPMFPRMPPPASGFPPEQWAELERSRDVLAVKSMRIAALVFAVLYLVVRGLTARARAKAEASQ